MLLNSKIAGMFNMPGMRRNRPGAAIFPGQILSASVAIPQLSVHFRIEIFLKAAFQGCST